MNFILDSTRHPLPQVNRYLAIFLYELDGFNPTFPYNTSSQVSVGINLIYFLKQEFRHIVDLLDLTALI